MANAETSTKKVFERSKCFMFFGDYRDTAIGIKEDFGSEETLRFYEAVIDYALYGVEPELKGVLKYTWPTTKSTIDASIGRRKQGFGREDEELTAKVRAYAKEHPNATQREIKEAVGCSLGKVNSSLKKQESSLDASCPPEHMDDYAGSDTDPISYSGTGSSSNTTVEREREQASRSTEEVADAPKTANAGKDSEREPEDLSEEELLSIIDDYKNRVRYIDTQKRLRLKGSVTSETHKIAKGILASRKKEKEDAEKNRRSDEALKAFGLSESEGDALARYLWGGDTKFREILWDDADKESRNFYGTGKTAQEVCRFLASHERARIETYSEYIPDWGFNQPRYYKTYPEYLGAWIRNENGISDWVEEVIAEKEAFRSAKSSKPAESASSSDESEPHESLCEDVLSIWSEDDGLDGDQDDYSWLE